MQFINNIHSVYPILLRAGTAIGSSVGFAERFAYIGACISELDLSERFLLELLNVGYLFIEFIESIDAAGSENLNTNRNSIHAARKCMMKFKDHLTDKFELLQGTHQILMKRISVALKDIITAVKEGRGIPWSSTDC